MGSPRKVIDDVDSPIAISPDGRQIAFVRGNPVQNETALFVAALDGSGIHKVASRTYSQAFAYTGATWSADGKNIITGASNEQGRAMIIDVRLRDGTQRPLSHQEWRWIGRINSIHNGDSLVFPAAEQEFVGAQIYEVSLRNHQLRAITSDLTSYNAVSAGERSIVAVQEDRLSSVWIAPLNNRSAARRITPAAGRYSHISWSPDGSLLLQTGSGREVHIWRFVRDGIKQQLTSGPYIDWNAAVSTDGKKLAFISNRGGGWHLWTSDQNGLNPRQLTSGPEASSSPSFTPDGSIVFAATLASSHLFKIHSNGGPASAVLPGPAANPVVSPAGEYVACEMDEGSGRQTVVVDMRTGRIIRRFPDIPVESWLRWTPDGKSLAFILTKGGVSNIAIGSISRAPDDTPDASIHVLTHFGEDMVFSFDISRDGRELAYIRGIAASDVVQFETGR